MSHWPDAHAKPLPTNEVQPSAGTSYPLGEKMCPKEQWVPMACAEWVKYAALGPLSLCKCQTRRTDYFGTEKICFAASDCL